MDWTASRLNYVQNSDKEENHMKELRSGQLESFITDGLIKIENASPAIVDDE
jgi:hypothetical protein